MQLRMHPNRRPLIIQWALLFNWLFEDQSKAKRIKIIVFEIWEKAADDHLGAITKKTIPPITSDIQAAINHATNLLEWVPIVNFGFLITFVTSWKKHKKKRIL